jgi:hypothetical protein
LGGERGGGKGEAGERNAAPEEEGKRREEFHDGYGGGRGLGSGAASEKAAGALTRTGAEEGW